MKLEDVAQENVGGGGDEITEETAAAEGGEDDESEREWEEDEDREDEELTTRVGIDDALLGFDEDTRGANGWSLRRRRHGRRWLSLLAMRDGENWQMAE